MDATHCQELCIQPSRVALLQFGSSGFIARRYPARQCASSFCVCSGVMFIRLALLVVSASLPIGLVFLSVW